MVLLEAGARVTIVDNLSNSFMRVLDHMKKLAGDKSALLAFTQVPQCRLPSVRHASMTSCIQRFERGHRCCCLLLSYAIGPPTISAQLRPPLYTTCSATLTTPPFCLSSLPTTSAVQRLGCRHCFDLILVVAWQHLWLLHPLCEAA
jgi:hypothetical protein